MKGAADKKEDVQYKYRKKNLMKRIIITGILILAAGLCLALGSLSACRHFYGETMKSIRACTCTRKGRWACYLASSATIPDVAECCGASFRFTRIFSDVLELDFYTGAILAGQMLFAHLKRRGGWRGILPRKKNSSRLFILVMMMPFQV